MPNAPIDRIQARKRFDIEDKIIVGRVLDIDDIVSFHGDSIAQFESSFRCAVDAYLDACASLQSAPDKPASGKLMLRVTPQVHAAALKAAARSGLSLNKWAESALGSAAKHAPKRAWRRANA